MKIILCLNRDIHAALALNLLLPTLKYHQVKIILSDGVGKSSNLAPEILELKKYEQVEMDELFAKIDAEDLTKFNVKSYSNSLNDSQTLGNQASATSQKFLTFNQIAQFFNNKITTHQNINSAEALTDIKNFAPDLIISIRFGHIFHAPAIAIPKYGIINLHSGIIPKYRGIMSSFWAILNGEEELGCTLHYIDDARIDFGRIIGFSQKKLVWERSFIFNVWALCEGGCKMIVDFIANIQEKNITTLDPNKFNEVNYFSTPEKNNVEKFCKIMPLITANDVQEIYEYWI